MQISCVQDLDNTPAALLKIRCTVLLPQGATALSLSSHTTRVIHNRLLSPLIFTIVGSSSKARWRYYCTYGTVLCCCRVRTVLLQSRHQHLRPRQREPPKGTMTVTGWRGTTVVFELQKASAKSGNGSLPVRVWQTTRTRNSSTTSCRTGARSFTYTAKAEL